MTFNNQIASSYDFRHCINQFSFDEFAQQLNNCKQLICVDTSVLHLAKLLEINCIVLLGGSNKDRICTSNYYKKSKITFLKSLYCCNEVNNIHCPNNLIKDCKHVRDGYSECMNNLTVESLVQEVKRF